MKPRLSLLAALAVIALSGTQSERAAAQNAGLQSTAPQSTAPQSTPPRNVAPQVLPPNLPGSGPAAPGAPPGPAPVVPPPPQWLPRTMVELRVLDKINARPLTLNGQVGQTLQFGTLSIVVRACMVHPPDQPADSAAFLDITDSREGAPSFHGWMFADEPALSMLEHPVYDVRVTSCHS